MIWTVAFHPVFRAEFAGFSESVQDELLAMAELLKAAGPWMKRPGADTLSGSKHANMKELRFEAAGGVWRVAYAFDPCGRRRQIRRVAKALLQKPNRKSGSAVR